MPEKLSKKEKDNTNGSTKPRRLSTPEIAYEVSVDVPDSEIQQRLDRAFSILFGELFNKNIKS